MLEGIHEARTDEFRRVLRACSLACSRGCQAVVLAVPRDQDPPGFLRAFYHHMVRKGGRPVRFVGSWLDVLTLEGAGGRAFEEREDGSFLAALDARERRFERLRGVLDRDLATDEDAGGPGLLILDADPASNPDIRAFLSYLTPKDSLWRAIRGVRGARAAMVTATPWGPDAGRTERLDGLDVLPIRPIEAQDVRAAADAAVDTWWSRVVGLGGMACVDPVPHSHSRDLSVHDLIAAGAYEAALERGPSDPRTLLWCLIAVGRSDEALEEWSTLPRQALSVDDEIDLGYVALARAKVQTASDVATRVSLRSPTGDSASGLACLLAEVALAQGDLDAAGQRAMQAVHTAKGPRAWARGWNAWGKIAYRAGRYEEAETAFRRATERVPDTDPESVRASHNLALIALRRGEHARAAALLQDTVVRADSAGLVYGAALTRHNLAVALEHLGRYRAAWQFAAEAADRFARLGRAANLAGALHTLADLLRTFGERDRAAALLERAEGIAREAGLPGVLDLCERTRGEMDLTQGEPARAAERFAAVRDRLEDRGQQDDADFCGALLAEALFEAGRVSEARGVAADIVGRGRGQNDEATGRAWRVLGSIIRMQEGPGEALSALTRAWEVLQRSGQREPAAQSAMALAESLEDLGDEEAALALREEARALLGEMAVQVPEEFRKSFERRTGVPGESRTPAVQKSETAPPRSDHIVAARPRLRHLVPQIVGESRALDRVLVMLERVRNVPVPVLLLGESGTGKELFAEALHRLSSRSSGPFVRVNAAAFTDTLLLSELFGHEKGAFTDAHARKIGRFEAAHGGTLFLDEIGDVSERLQSALLRVLEDQSFQRVGGVETVHVDVRLVFATNKDLHALMKSGRFREDLYHRISGVEIRVPPLRERVEDIPALAEAFAREVGREVGRTFTITREALGLLKTHPWPGNVRELRNVIRRVCLLMEGSTITPEVLSREVVGFDHRERLAQGALDAHDGVFGRGLSLDEALHEVEIALIREALRRTGGNIAAAARLLKVKRPRLSQMVKAYHLKESEAGAAKGGL